MGNKLYGRSRDLSFQTTDWAFLKGVKSSSSSSVATAFEAPSGRQVAKIGKA